MEIVLQEKHFEKLLSREHLNRRSNMELCLAHEQQFGTFGRPATMVANHHRSTLVPQFDSRLAMTTAANQSEESLQPIFQSSNGFPTKPKHTSNQVYIRICWMVL